MDNKKYNIILADPPWQYSNKFCGGRNISAEMQYPVLNIEKIKNIPVREIAAKNCILFLWVTWPLIADGLEVVSSWGFRYKTLGFIWIKKNKKADSLFLGLGSWTRANSEPCLLAIKGKPKRINKSVREVLITKRKRHSEKPKEVHRRIVALMGDLPRIELFARDKVEGWDVWGNEVDSDIKLII